MAFDFNLNTLGQPTGSTLKEARQGDLFAQTVDTGKIAQQVRAFDQQTDQAEAFKIQASQAVQSQNAELQRITQEIAQIDSQIQAKRQEQTQLQAQINQERQRAAEIKRQADERFNQIKAELERKQAEFNQPTTPTSEMVSADKQTLLNYRDKYLREWNDPNTDPDYKASLPSRISRINVALESK